MISDMEAFSCGNLKRILKYFLLTVSGINHPRLLGNTCKMEGLKLFELSRFIRSFSKKKLPGIIVISDRAVTSVNGYSKSRKLYLNRKVGTIVKCPVSEYILTGDTGLLYFGESILYRIGNPDDTAGLRFYAHGSMLGIQKKRVSISLYSVDLPALWCYGC